MQFAVAIKMRSQKNWETYCCRWYSKLRLPVNRDQFTLTEVAQGITQKLIRRHPHVFGDVEVRDAEEVHKNWEQIKAAEKGETTARLSGSVANSADMPAPCPR
jgi:hypothetical protein